MNQSLLVLSKSGLVVVKQQCHFYVRRGHRGRAHSAGSPPLIIYICVAPAPLPTLPRFLKAHEMDLKKGKRKLNTFTQKVNSKVHINHNNVIY